MWVWWMLSLFILISCVIFAYRMIVSSYKFLPADKRYFLKFGNNLNDQQLYSTKRDEYKVMKNRIQSFEDNNNFNLQFAKFQERLKAIEDIVAVKSYSSKGAMNKEEEDWKELYYEENAVKEKLENELDLLQQKHEEIQAAVKEKGLENWKEMYYSENQVKIKIENELEITKGKLHELQNKLKEATENNVRLFEVKGDYDKQLNYIHLLEADISSLQRQLRASIERENELENLLISEIIVREKYSMLQSKYKQVQVEANDLQRRIIVQSQKEMNMEIRLIRLSELESKLAICEEENLKLISRLENNLIG
jgi:hypothetical protein